MKLIAIAALFVAGLHADTLTVSIQDIEQSPQYGEFGFSSTGFVQIPGFDATLGTLQSVQVDWTAGVDLSVNYLTGPVDHSQVELDFTTVATASAFGFTGSGSQEFTGTVTAEDCIDCAVNASVGVVGGGTITDPTTLSEFIGGTLENDKPGRYAIFPDSVSAGASGPFDFDAAYATGQILSPSGDQFSGTVTYDYTSVPEPRWSILVFGALFIICLGVGRNKGLNCLLCPSTLQSS